MRIEFSIVSTLYQRKKFKDSFVYYKVPSQEYIKDTVAYVPYGLSSYNDDCRDIMHRIKVIEQMQNGQYYVVDDLPQVEKAIFSEDVIPFGDNEFISECPLSLVT